MMVLSGCGESTVEVDPGSGAALVGTWQYTTPGVVQSTIEFDAGGTFTVVDADLASRICSTESGSWSAEAGVLTTIVLERDGRPVTESPEETSFQRSGSSLTLVQPGDDDEVYSVATALPGCTDYGWMTLVMFAEIDGVLTDFSTNALAVIDLEGGIMGGNVNVEGLHDPQGLGPDDCTTCSLIVLDLFHELGTALTTGVYPVETFGVGGLRAETSYRPDHAAGVPSYGSNDSDPTSQPWEGEVIVSTLTAEVAEGTFEFVLYDGASTGPPYPSVVVTNGSFRLSFD